MNIWKGIKDHAAMFYAAAERGLRGTIPSRDKVDWGKDSRQVLRAKLRTQCINEMARLDVPRRIRRLMARKKAARLYREAP